MTREGLIEVMARAIYARRPHRFWNHETEEFSEPSFDEVDPGWRGLAIWCAGDALSAIEAAGVRLVNFAALAEDDAAVEKVARALCALANPPESLIDPADHSEFVRTEATGYRAEARAAIRALGE